MTDTATPGIETTGAPEVERRVALNPKQYEVVSNKTARRIMMVGGMGSGKSVAGAHALVSNSVGNPAEVEHMAVAPTYPNLIQTVLPRVKEVLHTYGVSYHYNKAERVITHYGGRAIWMRSADVPEGLSGSTLAGVWADECGLMPEETPTRMLTRVRDARATCRQIILTGTPEGTNNWFHRLTMRALQRGGNHAVVFASTYDNAFNDAGYLEELEETFRDNEALRQQYMFGRASEASGTIYTAFTPANLVPCDHPEEGQIAVGWDFNNRYMTTVIGTWFPHISRIHVWGEVVSRDPGGVFTEDHAQRVVETIQRRVRLRFTAGGYGVKLENPKFPQAPAVVACVDATGGRITTTGSRKSNAARSDHSAVLMAGFQLRTDRANPRVRNRIAAMQRSFRRGQQLIDPRGAPQYAHAVQHHRLDKHGEPQKEWPDGVPQLDHPCDAGGYLAWQFLPLYPGRQHTQRRPA